MKELEAKPDMLLMMKDTLVMRINLDDALFEVVR